MDNGKPIRKGRETEGYESEAFAKNFSNCRNSRSCLLSPEFMPKTVPDMIEVRMIPAYKKHKKGHRGFYPWQAPDGVC